MQMTATYLPAMNKKYWNSRELGNKGGSLVEYGMLTGLVAAIAIFAVLKLGKRVEFDYLVDALNVHEIHSPLGNYLVNGDFNDPSGMTMTEWGYYGNTIEGWTSRNGLPFEFHSTGWQGITSVAGDFWLDTNASPGHMDIEQFVTDLEPGAVYKLTLFAGDRDSDLDGKALIFWNGTFVGTLNPSVEDVMQEFTYYIREGDGDGTNRIRIVDVGNNDSNGLSLDQVRIWGQ